MVGASLTTAAWEVGSKCSRSAANRMETVLRKNSVKARKFSCWKVPSLVQTWMWQVIPPQMPLASLDVFLALAGRIY